MKLQAKDYIVIGLAAIALLAVWYLGYSMYPKLNESPSNAPDTLFIHDTVTHVIPDSIPYYIVKVDSVKIRDQKWMDSVILANKVDTAEILKDYYATHYYSRSWEDSLVTIKLSDEVSQNTFGKASLSYKFLKPQVIIRSDTTRYNYSKYLYLGLDVPIKDVRYTNIDLIYAFKKGYTGVGYNPMLNSVSIKGGFTLWKFH